MSIPSITIRPLVGSTNLKNDKASVLFPDPVRPRMPIYHLSVRFCSTTKCQDSLPSLQDVLRSSRHGGRRADQAYVVCINDTKQSESGIQLTA